MQNIEDEEQMEDLAINTILIFNLQITNKSMNNNCKSEGFGMQRSKDDLSWACLLRFMHGPLFACIARI
jgi:hypothetical protein